MNKRVINIANSSLVREMGSKCLMETNKTKAEEYQRRRKAIQQKFIDKENEINTMKNDIAALWEAINNMQKKKELE